MKGYVYFLRAREQDLYKIGFTKKSPQARIKELSTGCPYHLDLVGLIESVDSKEAERIIHGQLAQYRSKGEWFILDAETMENVLQEANAVLDIALERKEFTVLEGKYIVLRCKVAKDGISVTTEKCPFCGQHHYHGTGGSDYRERPIFKEGVQTLGHRNAHCLKKSIEKLLPNGIKVSNDDGYYLGI